jgi:soluble cytochrome b562
MTKNARGLFAGTVILALGLGLLTTGSGGAADDQAGVKESVQKLADAVAKGDMAEAKKLADEIAKSAELEEVMNLMSKRNPKAPKKAFGVGKEPGSITPDGIEVKIQNISRKPMPANQLNKESADLTEMAQRVAAISEIAKLKAPEKDEGAKKKKDWLEWADAMRKGADELAEAAKEKKPDAVKTAAAKLNSVCNTCHGTFRD